METTKSANRSTGSEQAGGAVGDTGEVGDTGGAVGDTGESMNGEAPPEPAVSPTLTAQQRSPLPWLLAIPVDQITESVDHAIRTLDELEAGLSWRYRYPPAERGSNLGRWRAGEDQAVRSVLRAADLRPDFLAPLAHLDGGGDDQVFETAPSWDHLARRDAVARLAARIASFGAHVGDSTMRLGDAINQVAVPAYRLVKVASATNESVRSELSEAIEFHGHAVRQRKRNAANPDALVKKKIKALRAQARAELAAKIAAMVAQEGGGEEGGGNDE